MVDAARRAGTSNDAVASDGLCAASAGHPSVVYSWVSVVWVLVWAGLLMVTVVGCCRSVGRGRPDPRAGLVDVPAAVLPGPGRRAGRA
jgi:hypothetical protein